MVRNTVTDRRRHSAVTAQPWAKGPTDTLAFRELAKASGYSYSMDDQAS